MKKSVLIFIFAVFPFLLFAQLKNIPKELHKNWRAGAMGGANYLAFELEKNFKQATMDMNSVPNYNFSFFLNKRFTKSFEVGIEFKKNYFSGFKEYSGNVVWLNHDIRFNNDSSQFIVSPIYYSTHISSWYFNILYNFPNFYSFRNNLLNLNLYLKAGIGFSLVGVELGYKDYSAYEKANLKYPLYGKGMAATYPRDAYGTWHFGTGFNYFISKRFTFNAEVMFLFVSTDYLDGVHNYRVISSSASGSTIERIGVINIVAEFKVGVSYHFNLYRGKTFLSFTPWKKMPGGFENEYYTDKKFNKVNFNNVPGNRK